MLQEFFAKFFSKSYFVWEGNVKKLKDREYSFSWDSKAGLVLQINAIHFFFFPGALDL